jgi:hypothetical protein
MAKPLTKDQPSSSVANLLNSQVVAAALGPTKPVGVATGGEAKATGEPVNRTREFHLTASTDATLKRAVEVFNEATGSNLTNSHFFRAVLLAVAQAMPELEREAAKLGPLKRPSNAPGHEADRDEFERKLADAFLAGIRAYRHAGVPV